MRGKRQWKRQRIDHCGSAGYRSQKLYERKYPKGIASAWSQSGIQKASEKFSSLASVFAPPWYDQKGQCQRFTLSMNVGILTGVSSMCRPIARSGFSCGSACRSVPFCCSVRSCLEAKNAAAHNPVFMLLSMPAWAADDSGSGDSNTGILSKISAAIDQVVAYVKGILTASRNSLIGSEKCSWRSSRPSGT